MTAFPEPDVRGPRGEWQLGAQSGSDPASIFAYAATKSTEAISCIAARKAAVRCGRSEICRAYAWVAGLSRRKRKNRLAALGHQKVNFCLSWMTKKSPVETFSLRMKIRGGLS